MRIKCQLDPCKSRPKMSLIYDNESTARRNVGQLELLMVSPKDARGHYRWFYLRKPGGNKEHQPLALNLFDIDVNFRESSHLISAFCTLADSELIPPTTQPNSTLGKTDTLSCDNFSYKEQMIF